MRSPFRLAHALGRWLWRLLRPVRKAFKPVARSIRILRHLAWYRVPDERDTCPACGEVSPVPLLPIPLEGRARSYGFASGCRRCGVVFANPLPTDEQVAQTYSPAGEWGRHRQDEQEKQVSRARIERLFEPLGPAFSVVAPPPGVRVIDFGCGLGGMLDALAALGWETYGVETAVKSAFERHRELPTVPASGAFDLAILHHVLEHVTDPVLILKQLAGGLREGGVLLVSVPNLDDVAAHGEMKYCIRAGVHVLAYTSASLRWLLAHAGFQVVSDRAGLAADNVRHRIVLARRVARPDGAPIAPLEAARRAVSQYRARHDRVRGVMRVAPVRMQTALLDLKRTKWRV